MKKFVFLLGAMSVVCFILFRLPILTSHADGTYANIGTNDAQDAGADAVTFSQGYPWTIDKYGHYIVITEDRNGIHHFSFSNDKGTNWTQGSENSNFMTRGSAAYDSINDKLHVIWTTDSCDPSGGIIYRRYSIVRDGSNNITDVTRDDSVNVNLQLDASNASAGCKEPIALWNNDGTANGTLIAIWGFTLNNQTEVRASMRHLSISAADGVAGNWVSLDGSADSFSSNAPAVAADKIYASSSTGTAISSAKIRGGTGSRKNDLYVFVASSLSANILSYRGIWNSGSHDWSGGFQAPINVGAFDESSGYGQKHELITKPVLDATNDRLYIGWARWKDNTAGDTVSFAYLDSTDAPSSTTDVYSANGTHAYAPCIDIAFSPLDSNLYIYYLESTTNGTNGSVDYKTFDGSSLSGSTRFYSSPGGAGGADGGADGGNITFDPDNNRIIDMFRINGAIPPTALDPHTIDFGYITVVTSTDTPTPTPSPTDTPTPTLTPTPTSAPASNNSSGGGGGAPDPNSHPGWTYSVNAGPNFQGAVTYLSGSGDASNALLFVSRAASHNDLHIDIKKASVFDLLLRLKPIPFPWMQGYNTASDIYSYNVYAAFNGYAISLFDNPVTIVLHYNPKTASRVGISRLRVGWFDPSRRRWTVIGNRPVVNKATGSIADVTKRTGYFSVIYPR